MNAHRTPPEEAWRMLLVGFGSTSLASSVQAADLPAGPIAFTFLAAGMVPAWFLVLVFGTMVAVLAVVLAVIGQFCLPKVPRATIYALSPVVSALLICALFWLKTVIGGASEEQLRAGYAKAQAQTAELIDLKAWWLVPDAANPQAVHLEIGVRASGRLAVRVLMGAQPTELGPPKQIFLMEAPDGAPPKPVKAGESLGLDVPLQRLNGGAPQAIAITLDFTDLLAGLPAGSGASVLDQVAKVYSNFPADYLDEVNVALPPAANPKAWSR